MGAAPISSVSSCAETLNSIRLPSTLTTSASAWTSWPTGGGQVPLRLISEFPKLCLTAGANHFYIPHCPVPQRGVAHVTDVGRDAVDAAARVTNGADADGEVVSF